MQGFVGSHLRSSIARVALGLVLPVAAVGVAAGCGAKNDEPAPFASVGTATPADAQATSEGREAARGVLGLAPASAEPSGPAPTAEQQKSADRYEAVASYLLALLEKREPGALARYATEMKSRDENRIIPAYVTMRSKLETLAKDPELLEMVRKDPLFAGALVPQASSPLGGRLELRDVTGGIPNLGRGADGVFGDGRTGALAAAADTAGLAALAPSLRQVDRGEVVPDPESRLGAYAATRGYPPGSVGHAVHNAIGTIYVLLGTYGEEKIGRVFNSPEARALYNDPVESSSGALMAAIEQRYWANVAAEDGWSPGGRLGAAFSPAARDFLQQNVFGSPGTLDAGGPSTRDGGADAAPTGDCAGKADGFWCIGGGYMAYCKGGTIGGGCPCAACTSRDTPGSCAAPAPPAACPVP